MAGGLLCEPAASVGSAPRLDRVQLAAALGWVSRSKSGSKLRALPTLRAIWLRIRCREASTSLERPVDVFQVPGYVRAASD